MHKSLISKFFILLLVVGLLFAAAPTKQAQAQTPYEPDWSIQLAADEIANSQMPAGGWGSDGIVAPQTLGEIGTSLIKAYARTQDEDHLAAIDAAATYLLNKTNNFAPSDGIFAAELDTFKGVSTYKAFVKENFFDLLAAGTYDAFINNVTYTDLDTAEYIALMTDYMNSWDPALGLISAHLCGADTSLWISDVKADLNNFVIESYGDNYIMAVKAIYSLALVGEEFDPTTGDFATASNLVEIAAQFAALQNANGSFWAFWVFEDDNVQSTGYAVLAFLKIDPMGRSTDIAEAMTWILSVQNAAGYWEHWGAENYMNTAMGIEAVNAAYPAEALCTTACYVSPTGSDTAMGNEATPFLTVQKGVETVQAGGTVHVAAGDYSIPSTMTLAKAITVSGPTTGEAKLIKADGITTNNIFLITASDVTIQNLTLTLNGAPTKGDAFIQAPDGAKANIQILNNKIYVDPQVGPMTGWQAQAIYFGRYTTNSKINNNTIYNTRSGAVAHYNCEVEYRDNVIYNTKGGIMNYASDAVNALERVMVNNSWGTVHNEWDIVWNSGAGVWDFDQIDLVLEMSKENNDAYVVTQLDVAPILSNRSHVFVNAVTGTETLNPANGNMNLPYKKIQDAIDAVVPGGKVIVAGGDYTQNITINKPLTLLGAGRDLVTLTGITTGDSAVVSVSASDVTIQGFSFQAPLLGKKVIKINATTSAFNFLDNRVTTADNPTNINGYAGLETNSGTVQTAHVITGNIFVSNHTSQMVYYNPSTVGVTFTGNQFIGTHMPNGAVLVFEALTGTFDISGNSFADTLSDAYGLVGLPGLTPEQMNTVFTGNTFPEGYAVVGTDIMIPPPVHNVTLDRYYTTIQAAMADLIAQPTPAVMTDYIINVSAGTYQVGTTIDILQQVNKSIVLQPETGDLVIIKDQIRIDGNARSAGTESLTIQGFTFDLTAAGAQDAITGFKTATYSYSHNVTIKDSTFLGDVANGDDVAVRAPALGGHYNYVLENLTGTNLHSLGQFTSVSLVTVKNCTVSGGLSGLNLAGSPAVVDNLTFNGNEIGIRTNANLTLKNSFLTSSGDANNLDAPYTALVLRNDTVKTITIENTTLVNTISENYAISNNNDSPTEKVTLVITTPVNTGGGTFDLDLLGGFGPISIIRVIDSDTTEYRFFDTIQDAIDGAIAGDTINVPAGVYYEELRINKSVTLLGPNADINPNTGTRVEEAVIKSSVDGAVITQVTGVSIKGFTFDGQGTSDSAIYAYDGAGSVVIENNILMNHDYGALVFYNYTNSGGVTTNNIIKNNKIETVTGDYGIGILLYNNFYAEVSGNVISGVRVGIQTGNYYRANTGAAATLSNNQITANRRGIFHNLHYSDASAFTITGNIIIAQDLATGTTFDGIMLSSLQTAVDAIVTNNTITIGNITQSPTTGYMIWNTPTTATLSVEGGTVSGADYGVWVNNYEGYSSDAHSTSVTIDGVTITGAEIGVYVKDSPDNTNGATVTAIIKNNSITAATGIKVEGADATASGDHNMVYATTDVENTNPVSMNFENNYWGSPCGATVVGVVDTIPWFEDEAMLVSKETNPSGNLTLTPDMTTLAINNTLACAAPYSTITFTTTTEDVEYPGNIIIPEGRDHLKIVLADGVKIQATSPCFTVEADYTTIKAENIGMAACVTAAGSNGIDVADGVVNLTVDGLEIYGPGNDGIHFNGVITDVVLKDNLIHDLAGNGVFFGAQPVAQTVGAIDIHGNMFQNNALNGIEADAFTVPAEYNSWGNVAGAAAGDGASSGVDADPFTHVDLYLESSGTPWANQVVSGQTITYTVMGHLVNASGAEFTLTYPENLTYVTSSAGTTFGLDSVTHTAGTRSLHFMGYSTTGNKTGTLPLFNVTFTAGTPVVAAPMLLDELTDGFAMAGVGSSANIYAAALLDSSVTIVTLPTVSSTDIQGYYLSGEQRQFSVVLDNPADGANYAHVYVDFTIANAQIAEFGTVEYSVDGGTTWVALGTGPGTSIANDGTNIVGYFGKVTGGGFALAPDASLTTLFRVTFPTREQGATDFPTSYAVTMQLMDADALPSALMLDDFSDTMYVYDKPTISSTDIQGYYLTGEQREFHVTGANPLTGKNYSNVMYKITLPDTLTTDITDIQYYETYPTTGYVPLALTQDGANVVAWFGLANYGGFPMPPEFSDSPSFLVTFATAKEYSVLIEQYDVALEPDRLLVAETFSATVYTKPVITPTNLGGPFDAGVPETVSLSIANTSIPEPFEVVFNYPAGTVISYGTAPDVVTVTCTTTCPPITVVLAAEPTVLDFTVTFDEAWTGDVSVSLYDSDWTPADRLLASAAATGAVVNGDFAVTGTFSMQGRSTRAGIPVTLTWGGALGPYANSADTIDAISNNFSLTLTYGGTYTVTTAQPRYLNVTTANAKTLSVPLALGKTMNPLELKAGNAKWDDNIINDQDSGMIASGYIQGITLFPNADVNFDNKINIQDLALVGGNYFVDSTVYNSWIVVTP